jgi:hypothetical protein
MRRLLLALVASAAVLIGAIGVSGAQDDTKPHAVPRATCGPGDHPETDIQGRVPQSDYDSGRAAKGYTCNARQVSHHGSTGGFKVQRYVDAAGHVCAYYDSTLMFPKDVLLNAVTGLGVLVLDMSDPRNPVQTDSLETPGMLTPHESVLLNSRRGILAAETGNATTYPAVLDLYDVKQDCRHPVLLSSAPTGLGSQGHESGFAPDGKTFYIAGNSGQTFQAMDISDPTNPTQVFFKQGVIWHGLRFSNDGRTMYVADDGQFGGTSGNVLTGQGLKIVDVSQIQDRVADPKIRTLSTLTWRYVSIPQAAEPFTRNGHHYLLETDEFAGFNIGQMMDPSSAKVGAARIINVDHPRKPFVVSDLRLQVHQPANQRGDEQNDPGARIPVQGYAAHYCSVPTRRHPNLAGCSMILSGLRVFDIRDVQHPKEVAYFNQPATPTDPNPTNPLAIGGWAMSQPAWDPAHKSIWYTDGNAGFFDVRLTHGVGKLLR